MKIQNIVAFSCCLGFLFVCLGCGSVDKGGPIAPVSGTLTLDGQPMPDVQIVFSPLGSLDNNNPGPYSVSTTDAMGKYKLKTRYGDHGAVIGRHSVTFSYPDIEAGTMEELGEDLREAKASKEETREKDIEEAKAAIDAVLAKLKGRKIIPSTANRELDVPVGGGTMDFELVSD